MKCRYCGHEIPDGMLYCEECGKEVRIVPDYNPLDDMLTAQVKGAISGENDYSEDDIYESVRNTTAMGRSTGAGRYTSAVLQAVILPDAGILQEAVFLSVREGAGRRNARKHCAAREDKERLLYWQCWQSQL